MLTAHPRSSVVSGDVLMIVRNARANLLVVGSDLATDATIKCMAPWLAIPVHRCVLPGPLTLPTARDGTLVMRNPAALDRAQQADLSRWLDESAERMQVICLTSTSLFAAVERGTFDDRLYYRLNTVLLYALQRRF